MDGQDLMDVKVARDAQAFGQKIEIFR